MFDTVTHDFIFVEFASMDTRVGDISSICVCLNSSWDQFWEQKAMWTEKVRKCSSGLRLAVACISTTFTARFHLRIGWEYISAILELGRTIAMKISSERRLCSWRKMKEMMLWGSAHLTIQPWTHKTLMTDFSDMNPKLLDKLTSVWDRGQILAWIFCKAK